MTRTSVGRAKTHRRPAHNAAEEVLRRAIQALAPYIEDGAVGWGDLQLALDASSADDAVRAAIMSALHDAGITVRGRPAPSSNQPPARGAPAEVVSVQGPVHSAIAEPEAEEKALAAARRLMDRDLHRRRPAKVLLTAEEEVGLGLIIQDDSSAKLAQGSMARFTGERRQAAEALYLHNTRLAWSVAHRYVGQGLELDDLIQWAMIGLVRAVELYDPRAGNKFSTYATWWLRQSVTRAIADEGRLIRVPVHMHERIQKVWRTRELLSVDGMPPRVPELARACALTPKEVVECLILRSSIRSIDEPVGDSEKALGDLLDRPDPEPTAYQLLVENDMSKEIHALLDSLSEREAGVMSMRFGLTDGQPKTLDEIGKVYGVTRERIRQIESKTIERLRGSSRFKHLRDYL